MVCIVRRRDPDRFGVMRSSGPGLPGVRRILKKIDTRFTAIRRSLPDHLAKFRGEC